MHDTHVHLDLLLSKLDLLTNQQPDQNQELTPEQKLKLETLLANHNLAIHSTVSWSNFELVWQFFSSIPKVKFLFGSHPELVDQNFNLGQYLTEQNHFWQKFQQNNLKVESKASQPKENLNEDSTSQLWSKLIGVGEIGLDYFYTQDKNLIQTQHHLFESQLELSRKMSQIRQETQLTEQSFNWQSTASKNLNSIQTKEKNQELELLNQPKSANNFLDKTPKIFNLEKINSTKNLPIIIHCRAAFKDLLAVLSNFPASHNNFLVHCFTGNTEDLRSILDLGGMVAFGGILTYKNAESLRIAAKFCPLESLVLETDLPFLSPQSRRSQVCLPEFVVETAEVLAQIKEASTAQIWESSMQNTKKLFSLE